MVRKVGVSIINQSQVYMVVGGIKLTSPTWWEFQYLQNGSKITVVCIPGWGARLLSLGYTISSLDHQFLLCLHSLLADEYLLEPLHWNSGRSWRLNEAYFL